MRPTTTIGVPTSTVAELLERRLKELDRSSAELAEAAQVPTTYINDLIAGRRQPPLPSRTDIYKRMTTYLGLGRNELEVSAQYERNSTKDDAALPAKPAVRRLLLSLCKAETAERLTDKKNAASTALLTGLMDRLLNVAQMEVRRVLLDSAAIRVAAEQSGTSSNDMRFAVLEFLDATAASLTAHQVDRFVKPRIVEWDADPEQGVLKVVLKSR
jgi:plasmid maintenance system antidote protein VapI